MRNLYLGIISLLAILFISTNSFSQCNITASASHDTICQGDTVHIYSIGGCPNYALNNDFNLGVAGTGWSATTGVDFTNPCNPTADGTTYMWMGSAVPIPRTLTTVAFDLISMGCSGGNICFDMKYATQSVASPCEGPDEYDEGVSLQYSTNGGATWVDIAYYQPDGTIMIANPGTTGTCIASPWITPLTTWANYCQSIPAAAVTAATQFRWIQIAYSSQSNDHWGLDNVEIYCSAPGQTVIWSHGPNTFDGGTQMPMSTTTYTVTVSDGVGGSATDNVTVVVLTSPGPPTVNGTNVVNCGDSVTLTASGSTGNYEWYSDPMGYNLIGTGSTYTTGGLSGDTTIYVAATNSVCPSIPIPFSITVIPISAPTATGTTVYCGDSATVSASGSSGNYEWFSDASGNNSLGTGSSITIGPLSNDTIIYVAATSGTPGSGTVQSFDFAYTGAVQTWTVPSGVSDVQIEVWGAEGGGQDLSGNTSSGYGGHGGYSIGNLAVSSGQTLNIYVGGAGQSSISGLAAGGWNGGGSGYASSSSEPGNGGGGGTDVRYGGTALANRVIVAGGGGGGGEDSGDSFGHGGGLSGTGYAGYDGTQIAAGTGGALGIGGTTNLGDGGGGGGGYYGGGTLTGASVGSDTQGGGGGSGYIGGVTGGSTLDGTTAMPNPAGGTQTGHEGDGYARITYTVNSAFCVSNLIPVNIIVLPLQDPTVTSPVEICMPDSVTLTASGSSGNYYWYDDPLGNNLIDSGSTYTTPSLVAGTTYYVQAYSGSGSTSQLYSFNTCGSTGSTGPTQAQVDASYSGTNLAGNVNITTQGIQEWTVPTTGTYLIEAAGGQGYGTYGGRGAYMSGEFNLNAGDVLKIIVGQQAAPPIGSSNQYGGGGGSFITNTVNSPLLVAGGGGGNWATSFTATSDAPLTNNGNTGANGTTNGAGGVGGAGGATASYADGGGGLTGNGGGTAAGLAFINGGTGGMNYGHGGFGGGGATSSYDNRRSGGGGGYSGGGASAASSSTTGNPEGGGGGSYNAGVNQNNILSYNSGDGFVRISINNSDPSCYSNIVPIVINNAPNATINVSAIPDSICVGENTTINASGANTYAWSTGGTGSSLLVNPGSTTTYTVTGTTTAGCTGTADIDITVEPFPIVTAIASPSSICPGQSSTLTASGASTYNWSTGGTGTSISVTPGATTTYYVTGTSAAGCTGTASVTVTISPNATITATASPTAICPGSNSTLTGSGGNTYAWSTGGSGTNISVGPTSSTTYYVTGTTTAGCSGTTSVTVTVNPNPTVGASASPAAICNGENTTLTGSGANIYTWSTGGSGTNISVGPASTTTYYVTGTSVAGCTGTAQVTVTVNPLPTVGASASPAAICNGENTTLTGSGANIYTWSTGGSGTNISVGPTSTTTYYVTGTSVAGCTGTAQVTVTVNPLPTVGASASPATICPGSSSTLTGSGASTYTWSTGGSGSIIVSPTSSTTYTVTGTSAAGCTGTASVTVNISPNLNVTATASPSAICNGENTSLSCTGATNYSWNTGSTANPYSVSPTSNTTYTVTGTDGFGCSGTASVNITVNPLPTVTASASPTSICNGQSTNLTGGGANTYAWSSGVSGANINASPTSSTTYTVTGTSTAGCTGTASVSVTVNPIPSVTASASPTSICFGENSSLSSSGASTYNWSSSGTGSPINVSPGSSTSYTVTGTSAAGCTNTASVSVTVNPLPSVIASASPSSICEGENTDLSASGANSYSWSSGAAGANTTVSPTTTTSYTVTGTTTAGCTGTALVNVTVNSLPIVGASANPAAICNGESTSLTATGANTYAWSSGGSGANINVSPTSTTLYTVTGTSTAGCTGTATVNVTVNPLPTITASASPSAICVGFSSTISAAGGDTYVWSNSNTSSSFSESPMATTIYQVTGTDINGCTGSADITLTVMPGLTINITPAMDEICEGDNSTLTASSPATGVTYNWDNGMNTNPITISPANTTTYTVTGTDAQGCSGTTSAIVTVNPLPTAQFSADPTQGCLPLNVQFDDQSTGNIAFWSWDFGDGNNSGVQNPNHTYNTAGVFDVELTVTTDKGCTGTLLIPAYINAAAIPTAAFIANPDIASEDNPTIQFIDQSIGATSWFWNFSDPNSSDPTSIQQNPMHTFTSSGEFLVTLTVSNDAECLDSTSGIVVIKPTFTFYIPNTFTPNADGKNEVFKPFGMGWDTDNYEMRIYNRWGELVFATTDINHGWNGTGPKGEDVPNGVYTAKIVVMELSGMEHYYDTKVNVIR